jgi:hypothetical protein
MPVPPAAAQEEAGRLLDDIYKISHAKTPQQKVALANQLLTLAKSQQVKPDERFVLLRKATDLAGDGGDVPLMLAAIRQTAGQFDFDSLAAQQRALARVAQRPMDAARVKALFAGVKQALDQAIAAGREEPARQLLALARQVAERKGGKEYRALIGGFQAEIAKASAHRQEMTAAEAALAASPDDPEANRAMAAYYCLAKADWKHGLACLAKGSDAQVRALAEQDLRSPPRQGEEQTKRADQWWEIAQARHGPGREVTMLRAAYWYEQAGRGLAEGLLKMSVAQRVGEIGR